MQSNSQCTIHLHLKTGDTKVTRSAPTPSPTHNGGKGLDNSYQPADSIREGTEGRKELRVPRQLGNAAGKTPPRIL